MRQKRLQTTTANKRDLKAILNEEEKGKRWREKKQPRLSTCCVTHLQGDLGLRICLWKIKLASLSITPSGSLFCRWNLLGTQIKPFKAELLEWKQGWRAWNPLKPVTGDRGEEGVRPSGPGINYEATGLWQLFYFLFHFFSFTRIPKCNVVGKRERKWKEECSKCLREDKKCFLIN